MKPFCFLLVLFLSLGMRAEESLATQAGKVTFHPLNHATLVISWGDKTIYVDPVGNADWYSKFAKPDLVLVTHVHGDHFKVSVLKAVAGPKTKLIMPPQLLKALPANLQKQAMGLASGKETEAVGLKVSAVAGYNMTPARKRYHPKGQGNGYVLTIGGKRIYLSGDTEGTPEMLALKNIDVAFLCMNLPYTMDVAAAAQAVRGFKPKVVYPYHYRGQDTTMFKKLVGTDLGIEVRLHDWYSR